MTYTAPEILGFIAALGVLVAALGAAIVNIIVALRTGSAIKENTAITAATLTTAKVIEGHVNSEQTKAAEQIISLERENRLLRDLMADKDKDKALLAQAAATTPLVPAPVVPPAIDRPHTGRAGDSATAAVLAEIEANTAETAKNTGPQTP